MDTGRKLGENWHIYVYMTNITLCTETHVGQIP